MLIWQRLLVSGCLGTAGMLLLLLATEIRSPILAVLLAIVWIVGGLLWLAVPGWRRLAQFTTCLGLVGIPVSLLMVIQHPVSHVLLALLLSSLVMLISGLGSIWRAVLPESVPAPRPSMLLGFKVFLDELVMGYFISSLGFPRGDKQSKVVSESTELLKQIRQRGWVENPAKAHPAPEVPDVVRLKAASYKHRRYQRLSFISHFPDLNLPGSKRWMAHEQKVRARLFEHPGEPRPWLMCIHGYRMGWLPLDFQLFPPEWLHNKLGFNLIMPILPLHGARRRSWRSGDGLFDGNAADMLHAVLQGVHDMRCLLAWLRSEREAKDIAILGYSLGGFHAALLASLESELRSVIAAIPLVDIHTALHTHAPKRYLQAFQDAGMTQDELNELLRPISPLAMPPVVPLERLGITAGAADRIVPVGPISDLIQHWRQENALWFEGSHLSVRREPAVRDWLYQQWQSAGLLHSDLNIQSEAS